MGTRLRRAIGGVAIGIATVGLLVLGFSQLGSGLRAGSPALGGLLLTSADVPAGLRFDPTASGPVDPGAASPSGLSAAAAAKLGGAGWVHSWATPDGRFTVRSFVEDMYDTNDAADAMRGARRSYRGHGWFPFTAPTVPGGVGAVALGGSGAAAREAIIVGFARGTLLFGVVLVAPQSYGERDAAALSAMLAARQLRRERARYGGDQPTVVDTAGAIGAAVGALLGYLGLVSGWAYLRDPLRRLRLRRRRASRGPGDAGLDVTADGRRLRREARVLFWVSLTGFCVTLTGFLHHDLPTRIILVAVGLALWLGATWYRMRHGSGVGLLWMVTGRRPVQTTALFALAIAIALLGCACLVQAMLASGGAPGEDQYLSACACFLAVAGIVHRRAHRLSAISARAALHRDARPPVLYLRSFGDDALRLRAATLGRSSLLERLSPNRFDSFEEVVARHLTTIGPVIAINQPGTKLAALGAARETLADGEWRTVVAEWMQSAALVVVGAPPGHPSPGLVWELAHVTDRAGWHKTVVIVPPLQRDDLCARWHSFAAESPDWPDAAQLGADPTNVLAMTRRGDTWTPVVADERSEWTYAAAVQAAARAAGAEPAAESGSPASQTAHTGGQLVGIA